MSGRPPDPGLASTSQSTPLEKLAEGEPLQQVNTAWLFKRMALYVSVIGVLALVTTYFTSLDWQWITFFVVVVGATVVSLATHSIGIEWMLAQRTMQLAAAHQTLARESA